MKNNQNKMLNTLKANLVDQPFKTAFKATLGFYVAQAAVTGLALILVGVVIAIAALLYSN